MCETLRLAGIVGDSITDGPGLRATVFVQGCPHRCPGCHNPQTHDPAGGYEKTVDAVYHEICRNPLLTGVTFSGGEPFQQAAALAALGRRLKDAGLEIAVYTGYTLEELLAGGVPHADELLAVTDTLVDGPFILDQRNLLLRFRGSENQRILDVAASLAAGHAVPDTSGRWDAV